MYPCLIPACVLIQSNLYYLPGGSRKNLKILIFQLFYFMEGNMAFLKEKDAETLKKRFEKLDKKVTIINFTQEIECQF